MADCFKFVIFLIFVITVANGHPGVGEHVTEEEHFNPDADAADLKDAMDKVNGQQIIDIVTERTSRERLAIVDAYRDAFQLDLIQEINSTLTGNFGKIIVALMTPLHDYYAQELKYAVSGEKFDIRTIAEILSTLTNHEFIQTVRASYEELSNNTLEEDLDHHISDHLQILVRGLLMANRSESSEIDGNRILEDAMGLQLAAFLPSVMTYATFKDIDQKFTSLVEYYFTIIFVERSYEHLRRVFATFEIAYDESIESAITRKLTKLGEIDLLEFLLVQVKCIKSEVDCLAERLHTSLAAAETDDKTLVRIMVTRSEIDLLEIIKASYDEHEESLISWIQDKTTGDYQQALLSIIVAQRVDGSVTNWSSEQIEWSDSSRSSFSTSAFFK